MILLLLSAIYGVSMHSSQAEDCVRGNHDLSRFGTTCEYLCHCGTDQCNRTTGACPNGECDGGWMGSGCQYVNIAYNTTVSSNHLNNTATIVDGRRDSCPDETQPIINPAYVMVSFGREVKITEVNIVFSNSVDVPQPFNVSVSDGNQSVLCGLVDYTNGQMEYAINCNSTFYGQCLNITYQWSAGFKVCEIQVPAGRNLAYGKPAIQSSLVENYYASNAVDGLTYHDSPWLSCTHTLDSNDPWWLLDLQASVMIQWFRIFNRWDNADSKSLNERLKHFRILLSQDNVTFYQSYQDQNNGPNDPPLVIGAGLMPDVLARFVKIDLQGTNRILSFCEAQVFGECEPGYYGSKCDKSCVNCKNFNCDKITGRCRFCVAGKWGDLCQIDCADGLYGDNCSHECGWCLDRYSCDKGDGHCPNGCQCGWKGAKCLQACDINYYGNCSTPCGHCKDSSICNKVNGSCAYGLCSEGWKGDKCNIVADNFHKQEVTDTNVVVIGATVGVALAIAAIIVSVVIYITVKRRRKRDTVERNTATLGMSPNSSNLAGVNADRPIQNFYNTTIERPRAYYNIEKLNQNQSGSTNNTSINATLESDVNLYSQYEGISDVIMMDKTLRLDVKKQCHQLQLKKTVVQVYIPASTLSEETSTKDCGTQSGDQPLFSIQNLVNDPQGIHFYTGLENYQNFKFVLDTLGIAAYHLNYYDGTLPNIGIEDQMFCTLIKLRRHITNFELIHLFKLTESGVTNVFVTWINFMFHQWKEVTWWPSRGSVHFFCNYIFLGKIPQY